MILQNGFGQSLAFWFAKGTKDGKIRKEDKNIVLFDIVKDWLSFKEDDVNNLFTKEKDRRKFIVELTGMDQQKYLSAQNEALALLDWVKRFAAADLE